MDGCSNNQGVNYATFRQDRRVPFKLSDLSNSIFSSLGVNREDPLGLGESPHGRECIVLIDGMGFQALAEFGQEFPIFSRFTELERMASHFPSTTVTNLSSLGTGELPGVHGMLGYTVRVPHSGTPGRLLNALKWDERVDPVIWQSSKTNFERARELGINVAQVAAKRYEGSGFTRAALRGANYVGANQISEMVDGAIAALAKPPSFAYVYLNNLDHAGHEYGVGSEKWMTALSIVADLLTKLSQRLPRGTRMWITADHGMVNVGESVILGVENDLMENISLLGGEPRARHLYVKEDALTETISQWREFFGDRVMILDKDEIKSGELFGAEVSPESHDRMGDFMAIPRDDLILIDPLRIPQESSMVGHHGGLSEIEVDIPLLSTVL